MNVRTEYRPDRDVISLWEHISNGISFEQHIKLISLALLDQLSARNIDNKLEYDNVFTLLMTDILSMQKIIQKEVYERCKKKKIEIHNHQFEWIVDVFCFQKITNICSSFFILTLQVQWANHISKGYAQKHYSIPLHLHHKHCGKLLPASPIKTHVVFSKKTREVSSARPKFLLARN